MTVFQLEQLLETLSLHPDTKVMLEGCDCVGQATDAILITSSRNADNDPNYAYKIEDEEEHLPFLLIKVSP